MTIRLELTKRPCPICAGEYVEKLRRMRFVLSEGHPLADGYAVVCCDACGFIYADTTVTQQDYDAFYANFSKYADNQTSTGGGGWPLDAVRLRDTAVAISEFLNNRDARILDIGCANGGLLAALQALGQHTLVGVDPSPICVDNVRRDYGIEAHIGALSDPLDGLGAFDCVILSHVLEHVQELQLAVQAVALCTAPDGVVYIEVPDATRYVDCLVAPFQDFNTEHINHFSATSLTNLMAKAGFRVSGIGEKTIWAAPQAPYPALYGFFVRNGEETPVRLERDVELRSRIDGYIAGSQAMLDGIDRKLAEVLARSPEVVVWGTGQLAMKLLAETALGDAHIVAFVDGNPVSQGKRLRGAPILSPRQFADIALPQPVIITSTLHAAAIADTIQNQLQLPNEVVFL